LPNTSNSVLTLRVIIKIGLWWHVALCNEVELITRIQHRLTVSTHILLLDLLDRI